jgi:hypothetical protein
MPPSARETAENGGGIPAMCSYCEAIAKTGSELFCVRIADQSRERGPLPSPRFS